MLTPDDFLIRQFHLNQELLVEKLQDQAAARQIPLAALLTVLGKRAPKFGRQVWGALRMP